MKQEELQRLYDDNEAANGPRTDDYPYVKVRYRNIAGWVGTYSGEEPRRYLVRLDEPVDDPDHPDFGPTTSLWVAAAELEAV